jgi:hypothetical protein
VEDDVGALDEREGCGLVPDRARHEAAAESPQRPRPLGPAHEGGHGVAPRGERLDEVGADESGRPGDRRPQIGLS